MYIWNFHVMKHKKKKVFLMIQLAFLYHHTTDNLIWLPRCWDIIQIKLGYCFFSLLTLPHLYFHLLVYHRVINRLKYEQGNVLVNVSVFDIKNLNFLLCFAIKSDRHLCAVSPVCRWHYRRNHFFSLETRTWNVTVWATWFRSWICRLPTGGPWQVT